MNQLKACALLALLSAPALAQQAIDADVGRKEIDAIFARPANTPIDTKTALPALDAWLERQNGKDLGELGYVPALREFLAHDYTKAVTLLDAHLAKHTTIASSEHRVMAGRIFMNGAMTASRAEPQDTATMLRCAERAAQLYDPPSQIARLASTLVSGGKVKNPEELRVAVLRGFARSTAKASDIDAAMSALYAPAAPAPARTAKPAAKAESPSLATFKEKAMSGKTIDLASYKGKVVVVDFWATWCGPCMREMPNVVAAYEKYHTQGLEIIGISLDKPDAEQEIKDVEQQLGMKWEQIYDGGFWQSKLAVENGIHGIPATFVLDKTGKVRFTKLRGEALDKAIAELLAEQGSAK